MRSVACLAAALAVATGALAMGKDEYRAHLQRVDAEYDAARARCKPLKDPDRDLCKSRAKGTREVARAELQARLKPTAAHQEKVAMARAEAALDLAETKCRALKGHAREICRKDAKAEFAAARADAKAARALPVADENLYAAGRQRCDAMSGQARELCVEDLRRRFGRL